MEGIQLVATIYGDVSISTEYIGIPTSRGILYLCLCVKVLGEHESYARDEINKLAEMLKGDEKLKASIGAQIDAGRSFFKVGNMRIFENTYDILISG